MEESHEKIIRIIKRNYSRKVIGSKSLKRTLKLVDLDINFEKALGIEIKDDDILIHPNLEQDPSKLDFPSIEILPNDRDVAIIAAPHGIFDAKSIAITKRIYKELGPALICRRFRRAKKHFINVNRVTETTCRSKRNYTEEVTIRSLKVFGYYLAFLNYLNAGDAADTKKIPFLVEIHGRRPSKKHGKNSITMFMYGFDDFDNNSEQIKGYYQGLVQELNPKLCLEIKTADSIIAKKTGIFKLCDKVLFFEFPPTLRQKTRESFRIREKYQSVFINLIKYCREL